MIVKLSPGDHARCAACPDAWFRVRFDTEFNGGPQGFYIQLDDGTFRYVSNVTVADAIASGFPAGRIYEAGRDGYYLTMAEARQAIDVDAVTAVLYVDDFNDEYQDFFICKDDDDHTPFVEATIAELIR